MLKGDNLDQFTSILGLFLNYFMTIFDNFMNILVISQ